MEVSFEMANIYEIGIQLTDPERGLPPKSKRWPTAEDLREAMLNEPDPVEQVRELRRRVPFAGRRTSGIRIKNT